MPRETSNSTHDYQHEAVSQWRDDRVLTQMELTKCTRCGLMRRHLRSRYDFEEKPTSVSTTYSADNGATYSTEESPCKQRPASAGQGASLRIIPAAEARAMRGSAACDPWTYQSNGIRSQIVSERTEAVAEVLDPKSAPLLAAAPSLAYTVEALEVERDLSSELIARLAKAKKALDRANTAWTKKYGDHHAVNDAQRSFDQALAALCEAAK